MNNPAPHAPQPPPKKGLSVVAVIFIVLGVLLVLSLGTCVVAGVILKGKVERAIDGAEGGSFILVSPPAVVAELAGAKKDYVGSWKSARDSTLDIDAQGNFKLVKDEGGAKETYNAAIAAFNGNDIEVHAFVKLTIPVTSPPTRSGDRWTMTLKGVKFERTEPK